jgi:hypothetical protein
MLPLLIQVIVALLIAGFVFWAVRLVLGLIPMEPIFSQAINVILIIVVVAIIIFYVVIPLLNMLAGVHIGISGGGLR